jgi:hypothetical protein
MSPYTHEATRLPQSSSFPSYLIQPIQDEHIFNQNEYEPFTADANHPPNTLPYQPIPLKPVLQRQRVRGDLNGVLDPANVTSYLDLPRRKLLEYILGTDWYRADDPEPRLGTSKANDIFLYLKALHNVSFPEACIKAGRSIYSLLTDPTLYKCLRCGSIKKSVQRAVDCVRAHIEHRPFRCLGWRSGCGICRPGQEYVPFSTSITPQPW